MREVAKLNADVSALRRLADRVEWLESLDRFEPLPLSGASPARAPRPRHAVDPGTLFADVDPARRIYPRRKAGYVSPDGDQFWFHDDGFDEALGGLNPREAADALWAAGFLL